MVDRASPALSVSRQSVLLGVSRRSVYYTPRGESDFNLRLMRAMDEQYLSAPWYGSRQMARALRRMGYCVGRKRVRRLVDACDGFAIPGAGSEHIPALAGAPGLSVSVAGFEH